MCVAENASVLSKLTTFTGGGSGVKGGSTGGVVQMRRPTNRRGKTAPAPPKRTSLLSSCSSFRDSCAGDGTDQTNPGADFFDDNILNDINGNVSTQYTFTWYN